MAGCIWPPGLSLGTPAVDEDEGGRNWHATIATREAFHVACMYGGKLRAPHALVIFSNSLFVQSLKHGSSKEITKDQCSQVI
uniref:Uncharacterized protein n=1 Tax=Anolis carolinensis TaxID=28377 RepID=A0A803SVV8_ANOCA